MSEVAGQMNLTSLLALAAALGWASGFRLYAVVFMVGMAGAMDWITLPQGLDVLQHPAMLTASGAMLFLEFFADKIPGLDSVWDLFNSIIRIPAGALLAASVFGADSTTLATVAALLGGTLAASSQLAKSTTRAAINTSPEPFSNLMASLFEDGLAVAALWLAMTHPLLFVLALVLAVALLAWLTVLMFKFLKLVIARVSRFLAGSDKGGLNV
jgi:hypothetical protein